MDVQALCESWARSLQNALDRRWFSETEHANLIADCRIALRPYGLALPADNHLVLPFVEVLAGWRKAKAA